MNSTNKMLEDIFELCKLYAENVEYARSQVRVKLRSTPTKEELLQFERHFSKYFNKRNE